MVYQVGFLDNGIGIQVRLGPLCWGGFYEIASRSPCLCCFWRKVNVRIFRAFDVHLDNFNGIF